MGSTVETSVRDIEIHRLPPGKVVAIEKAVSVDGTTVFLGKDGKIYCPRVKDRLCYPASTFGWTKPLMNGLVKLGVMTRSDAEKIIGDAASRSARIHARCDLESLDRISKEHGLKVSARERAKLVKAAGGDQQ